MNSNDFKKLLDESLKPIKGDLKGVKKDLEIVNNRLGSVGKQLNDPKTGLKRINEKLDALWDQTVKLTANEENVKESLKNKTASLNRANDNIKRVDKRLRAVENHSGIVPPPELTTL